MDQTFAGLTVQYMQQLNIYPHIWDIGHTYGDKRKEFDFFNVCIDVSKEILAGYIY